MVVNIYVIQLIAKIYTCGQTNFRIMKKLICVIIGTAAFLLLFAACTGSPMEYKEKIIAVDVNRQDSYEYFFAKDYKSITLETPDEGLIGEIKKIQLTDSCIYVFDWGQKTVFVFDSKGYFVRKYSHVGQGEGEYVYLSDFEIYNNHLYLLSRTNRCIYKYTLDDRFVDVIKVNDWYDAFHILNENCMLLYSNRSNNTKYNVVKYNYKTGIVLGKYLPFKRNDSYALHYYPFYETNDGRILLIQPYDYSVYTLKREELKKICEFSFNTKDKIPKDAYDIPLDQLHTSILWGKSVVKSIEWMAQKDSIIYATYVLDYKMNFMRANLNTGVVYNIVLEDSDEYPYAFIEPISWWRGKAVSICDAGTILFFSKGNFPSDKNPDGLLHEDDNPVIFIRELK